MHILEKDEPRYTLRSWVSKIVNKFIIFALAIIVTVFSMEAQAVYKSSMITAAGQITTLPVPINQGGTNSITAAGGFNNLSNGTMIDPRDPQFGSNTCTGYYPITTSTLNAGGTGYAVNDTFKITNSLHGGGNTAFGIVTGVSGSTVTTYSITTAGGGYAVANAITTTATSGGGSGLKVNITAIGTGNDDTAAFTAASTVATATGAQLWIPHGCWVANWTPPANLHAYGAAVQASYGYDGTIPPVLYAVGHPAYVIHTTNEGVSLYGFEVNATHDAAAMASTVCIGSATSNQGGGGFGEKNTLRSMSAKGCATGYGSLDGTGGYLFTDIYDSDFGANDYGIRGPISDLVLDHSVFASDSHTGLWLTASAGGSARISHNRFEYNKMGMELDGAGGFQSSLTDNQCDRADNACLYIHGVSALTLINEQYKGGGAAGSLTITGAVDNGSGLIRLTVLSNYGNAHSSGCTTTCATNGLTTGDKVTVSGVLGTIEANGNWTLTVVDSNHIDLQASAFTHAYTSGGFGGVKGKDSPIYIDGVSNQISFENFFCSGTSAGAVMPSVYCVEGDSAATIAHITFIGGIANLSPLYSNSGFLVSFDHWLASTPVEYLLDVIGAGYFRNDYIALTGTTTQDFAVGRNGLTNPSFQVDDSVSGQVNGVSLKGSATNNAPSFTSIGSDTNIGLTLGSKGTTANDVILKTGNTVQLDIGPTSMAASEALSVTGAAADIFAVGRQGFGSPALQVDSIALQVTGVRIKGQVAGAGAKIETIGGNANEDIYLGSEGASSTAHIQVNGGDVILGTTSKASISGGIVTTGTKFTTSGGGCTVASTVGGAISGQFTANTTGVCTTTITMNGGAGVTAPNGWACWASNITTGASGAQTASSTTTATIAIPTTSGNTVVFGCLGF